jgi:hypothetical protein
LPLCLSIKAYKWGCTLLSFFVSYTELFEILFTAGLLESTETNFLFDLEDEWVVECKLLVSKTEVATDR